MKPILYATVTEGTVPSNYGLGALDCLSCKVTEERNGSYELVMEYAAQAVHAEDIQVNRFIKAKPNFTDNPQLFRIYKISKVINGKFTVNAQHISYDLSGKLIQSGSAASCVAACALLQAQAGNFTINTDKSVSASFSVSEPSSVRSWFGGKAGSLLDVYGGEWKYDNYTASLKQNRGADRGVEIRYGKNLTDLSQELNTENLCTGVVPYYIDQDGNKTIGAKVSTGLTLDVPKDMAVDFSNDVDAESATPILTQLANLATAYIARNNFTTPTDSIELDFVQIASLQERVDLCDTVHIYFEALGVSATAKCITTEWDVLEERYTSTTFGDTRTNIADTILDTEKQIKSKPTLSEMDKAVQRATELITGNLGGYVVIHDSNGDGQPDEILIMNTDSISTATKIWRWNQQGLGYATSYAGPYGLAMTADGAIVADFITAGTLSGNRVRTGLISSTNNVLQIDLDNGTITAPSITLNGQDVGSTLDSLVQTSVVTTYALSNSGTVIPSSFPLSSPTQPTEQQPYLWSKTVYTYANNQTSTSYTISTRGANGTNGQDGAGLAILGNYDTMEDLIADHPTGSAGQAYMVGTDLVVWNTQTSSWENVGRIQGPSGFDGLWLAIENDDDGTNANVTYTVKLYKGVTDVTETYDAVFVWQLVKEAGVTEIANNTDTVTVARDSADYGATVRAICIAILTEETLQDYAYATIQDYTGNDIQIIGSNTVKLIGESEIYKPYAISSQFQVLSDEISSKVSQTDFNSLSGTVTTQGTQIQQNASAILLKADTTTVNTALNGKMGTDMSNRASSILIDSGQIRFDSNSIVVNSSQFTLDASGNAVFKGKLNAAELYIGGEYVGLGDAINDAESSAISAAATDATQKANDAQDAAINAAAADATQKANSAKQQAITTANTYTESGLATKVGNNEVRTKFAADAHSVTIQSGTVKFKSNTLLIDSTQFTLDAQGNAVFKGNLSAATLVIGGQTTNIGTAISNAESDAISAAASDATNKANAAISAASEDATQKMTSALNSAEIYADGVAGDAETNAKGYTDGKITVVNQSLTVMSGQIASKVSQTDFNTLSNTVSSQGTAIEQNAQAITLKADSSTVNTQMAGKMATDMSNRSSSITINSGEIKFQSNTVSIDATNLTVTKTGLVTAKKFIAKDEFYLEDASGNKRGFFKYPITGTHFAITGSDETILAEIWDTGSGGSIRINDALGDPRLTLWQYNNNGMAYIYDSTGDSIIKLSGYTGNITCVGVIQTSSRKVKENIQPMTDEDAEKILELQAVSFDYKNKARGTNKRGFIAEDVAEVLPNLVTPETKESPASLDYIEMIPYLQAVIKKQEERIKALEEKINKLMED